MTLLDEIQQNTDGAKFVRADLHIHSFGEYGSYDVKDDKMSVQNIVDTALTENIQVISITDHNSIGNVKAAIDYAAGKHILVIPGVELSTPDGHLLVYLPNLESLNDFFRQFNISTDKKMCNATIIQCLSHAQDFGGFGIAAHIELSSGFEMYMSGYTPFKEAILKHPALMGLEITSIANETWFTDRDTVAERKNLINVRRRHLKEDLTYDLAKVMSSDSHTLDKLGRNAAGNQKLTRLKMNELNFASFRIALTDCSARVRIEDLIPQAVPHFVGLKFDGGFLNGQVVKFNKNLTCIIGGRGAGKSTLLESVRACSGNPCKDTLIDNEVWPDRISLIYEDQTGRQLIFTKDKLKEILNVSDNSGIKQIQIESFGQGETAETIQHSGKDPAVLMKFFDSFLDFGTLLSDDNEIRQALLDNQTAIERVNLDIQTIPQIESAKKNADDQVLTLKSKGAKEAVELEEAIANERALRQQVIEHLNSLIKGIQRSLSDKSVFELVLNFSEEKIFIGKQEFNEVKQIVSDYSKEVDEYSKTIDANSNSIVEKIHAKLKLWKEKEVESQNKVETIRKDIESKGGKLDIGFIRKVTKDASEYASKLAELQLKKKDLNLLTEKRNGLLQKRNEIKKEIHRKRTEFIIRLNSNLKATIEDFSIDIKLFPSCHSPELVQIIKDAMAWRTSAIQKAELMVSRIPYPELLTMIRKKEATKLNSIEPSVFSKADAEQILTTLSQSHVLYKIERCPYNDVATITLTKKLVQEGGTPKFITRDFSKLSLGQKQSMLLSILLFSNRDCPLLIDQPEDNLDSEFIYQTVVKNLRRIKECRQVIIVTHNANIAVLSDAELILPLKSTNESTLIMDRGSIDTTVTRKATCAILEGGEKAFVKRREMYGI
jgi:ABC-type lipoprotein export system ATPase subunit